MDQWPSSLHSIHISYGANMSFLGVFPSEDVTKFFFSVQMCYFKSDFWFVF